MADKTTTFKHMKKEEYPQALVLYLFLCFLFFTLTVTYPGEQGSEQQGKVDGTVLEQHEGGSEERKC